MVKTLARVHSNVNLKEEERKARENTKRQNVEYLESNKAQEDTLNSLFTHDEMKRVIMKAKITSPGKDKISYAMLKHLNNDTLMVILGLFNKIWTEGKLPNGWTLAVIVPIKKPGKESGIATNYRPIALTSHLGKIMERMIVERLTYCLEVRNLISKYQSGFRKGRSTMNPIINLESDIRKAQTNKEIVAAVFFDVEKAHDMLWKEGVLIEI